MEFQHLTSRLRLALKEDSAGSDITTRALPSVGKQTLSAHLLAKQDGVISGLFLLPLIFRSLDPRASIKLLKKDGDAIKPGQSVAKIRAKAPAVLGGERLMLNLVCHLSGVATATRRYVNAVRGTPAKILDTRKTTPLWRDLEKYAVTCGGGENHRFSLGDAILVKDNHHQFLRELKLSARSVYGPGSKKKRGKFTAIEAATLAQVWEAIKARPEIILLDNMPLNRLKTSIELIKAAREALKSPLPLIEVSGGVTPEKAKEFADAGVDRISVGAITHSATAIDLSLEVY